MWSKKRFLKISALEQVSEISSPYSFSEKNVKTKLPLCIDIIWVDVEAKEDEYSYTYYRKNSNRVQYYA